MSAHNSTDQSACASSDVTAVYATIFFPYLAAIFSADLPTNSETLNPAFKYSIQAANCTTVLSTHHPTYNYPQ